MQYSAGGIKSGFVKYHSVISTMSVSIPSLSMPNTIYKTLSSPTLPLTGAASKTWVKVCSKASYVEENNVSNKCIRFMQVPILPVNLDYLVQPELPRPGKASKGILNFDCGTRFRFRFRSFQMQVPDSVFLDRIRNTALRSETHRRIIYLELDQRVEDDKSSNSKIELRAYIYYL